MTKEPKCSDAALGEGPWIVEAVIQPFRLDAVTRSLEAVPGFSGMTVADVRGFGTTKLEVDRGAGASTTFGRGVADFEHKIRIVVAVVGQANANGVASAIQRAGHTGNAGDGVVFLWPIAQQLRIRTGEQTQLPLDGRRTSPRSLP